jgi:phosphatidylglycerophosphate synthase
MSRTEPGDLGLKELDYFWTVVVVDPLAIPLVRLFARWGRPTPDQTSWISFLFGIVVGSAFAFGGRWGLVAGGILFYVSFAFDCVDGKLARVLRVTSDKGKLLDDIADGARRASASLGLIAYLWGQDASEGELLLAVGFAVLSFYFMQISGGPRAEPSSALGGTWAQALARRRLLPNPGMPDVSGIVFVIGPITGLVVPALVVGAVLVGIGILRVLWGSLR